MTDFPKPTLVISRCIEFDHCRWNGLMIASDVVKLLRPYVEFLPVCPEVEIGLGVPRAPVRLIEQDGELHLYQPATGRFWTAEMREFAGRFLDSLPKVEGFVLKSRSPSCGIKDVKVYPGTQGDRPHKLGEGFFAAEVARRFAHVPREDEGRLTNFRLREHFLTQIYLLREWREVVMEGTMGALVRFHTRHKLLLMAYSENTMRRLGRLVAQNPPQANIQKIYDAYRALLTRALARPPRFTAAINVLQHAMGYFQLSSAEKAFFLDILGEYRAGRVPLSVPTSIVRSWIVRFGESYLAGQSFFLPYPEELVQITDSGKGRDV
ncbi:MAG: DUF1722 domain-containing protein [Chloroflexi bacterium]|nr:DUF1722 domain-containing protein [Chloroflexota bacterium]